MQFHDYEIRHFVYQRVSYKTFSEKDLYCSQLGFYGLSAYINTLVWLSQLDPLRIVYKLDNFTSLVECSYIYAYLVTLYTSPTRLCRFHVN